MKKKRSVRNIVAVLLLLIVILGITRIAAPSLITKFANQQIENTSGMSGQLDAAVEVIGKNGVVNGYVKAGIYNAQVFTWKGDIVEDDNGLLTGIFEGLVDGFASIFESNKRNLLAVNVPISGTIDNTEISTLDALISLFHNAFINAYEIKVDDTFDLDAPIGDNQDTAQTNNDNSLP